MKGEKFENDMNIEPMKLKVEIQTSLEKDKKKNLHNILKKILPVIAAIVIIIGLANFIGLYDFNKLKPDDINSDVISPVVETPIDREQRQIRTVGLLTSVPRVVEKTVFERFMQNISENAPDKIINKFGAYYGIIILERGEFYIFSPDAANREAVEILGYWNEYTGWNDVEYQFMLMMYQLNENDFIKVIPRDRIQLHRFNSVRNSQRNAHKEPYEQYAADEPEYAHARFGASRDVLLLDIEWHDVHSYAELLIKLSFSDRSFLDRLEEVRNLSAEYPETAEFIVKFEEWYSEVYRDWIIENINSYGFTKRYKGYSEEEKEAEITKDVAAASKFSTDELTEVSDGKRWQTKTINGKERSVRIITSPNGGWADYGILRHYYEAGRRSEQFKAEFYEYYGYYMYEVYPTFVYIGYADESGEYHSEQFGNVFTQDEFNGLVNDEIIPFLDDLIERGLITQEYYDWTISDPLDKAVGLFFGE